MSQENVKELTGYITGLTKSPKVMILSFQEQGQQSAMALTLETNRYHELFPAGDPILGLEVVVVLKQTSQKMQIEAIYNPEGDFIAADELPEIGQLNHQLDDSKESDLYAALMVDRQKAIDKIEASSSELERLAQEHDADNETKVASTDYGDPVSDQGGQE